jgi:hypothetical protein
MIKFLKSENNNYIGLVRQKSVILCASLPAASRKVALRKTTGQSINLKRRKSIQGKRNQKRKGTNAACLVCFLQQP